MVKNLRYLAEEHNKRYFFYFDRLNIDFEENPAAYSSNRTALCWEYGEQTIQLNFPKGTEPRALCSLDKKYVIVIYDREGINGKFFAPNNGVIYNADGSIYKILPSVTPEGEKIIGYYDVSLNKEIYKKDFIKERFNSETKIIISVVTYVGYFYRDITDYEFNLETREMIFVLKYKG